MWKNIAIIFCECEDFQSWTFRLQLTNAVKGMTFRCLVVKHMSFTCCVMQGERSPSNKQGFTILLKATLTAHMNINAVCCHRKSSHHSSLPFSSSDSLFLFIFYRPSWISAVHSTLSECSPAALRIIWLSLDHFHASTAPTHSFYAMTIMINYIYFLLRMCRD